MRCLNCSRDGIAVAEVVCPGCGVHLPSLLRDVLPPRTTLAGNRYRIEYAIGRGGFGITYRAVHIDLGQRVAIKEFFPREQANRHVETGSLTVAPASLPAFKKALTQFLEEGPLLARLNQPNVVQVRDFFKERETAYLVMEYLSGQTLRSELETAPGGKLAEQRVREVMSALVGALSACHKEGIYHLDIKPENVMVEASGRIVLIDFGASRQGLGTRTTQAFTPGYAPPELMSSGMTVGPQSDLFELGMLLHELLTGKLPPDAMSRAFKDDWQPQGVSEPYRGLVGAALKLKQDARPSNVASWWRAAEKRRTPGPEPEPAPTPPPPPPDVEVELRIAWAEALSGCEKPVKFGGKDRVIKVPAGSKDGQVLRVKGAVPGVDLGGIVVGSSDLRVRLKVDPEPKVDPKPSPSPPPHLTWWDRNGDMVRAPLSLLAAIPLVTFCAWFASWVTWYPQRWITGLHYSWLDAVTTPHAGGWIIQHSWISSAILVGVSIFFDDDLSLCRRMLCRAAGASLWAWLICTHIFRCNLIGTDGRLLLLPLIAGFAMLVGTSNTAFESD